MLSFPLFNIPLLLSCSHFLPILSPLLSLDFDIEQHDMNVYGDIRFNQPRYRYTGISKSLLQITGKWKHETLHLFILPCPKTKWLKTFSICPLWQSDGSVLGCSPRIELPHIGSYKVQLRGFSFCDVIWAIQFSLYLLSIFCQFGRGTHCVRWRGVSLVSSRYCGFGVAWPRRSLCGKGWWLCGALQQLSACPFGLRQAHIHSSYSWRGQHTGQNTPFDSPQHTGVCGRRWNWVFCGPLVSCSW